MENDVLGITLGSTHILIPESCYFQQHYTHNLSSPHMLIKEKRGRTEINNLEARMNLESLTEDQVNTKYMI